MTLGSVARIGVIALLALSAGCKPALTKATAAKLIPDGMSEAGVYATLGTNATVSAGQDGQKYLVYFFPYFPAPPQVKPKIDVMTVVISNGVVTRREFAVP
jgi:hypothetical protein